MYRESKNVAEGLVLLVVSVAVMGVLSLPMMKSEAAVTPTEPMVQQVSAVKSESSPALLEKRVLPNVELDARLIEAVLAACEKYAVPVELALAVMEVESGYQVDAINGDCVGLYQINTNYLIAYEEALGVTDINDPVQNIKCGVWYLGQLLDKHGEVNLALMYYNIGNKADRLWREGVRETDYTIKVNAAWGRIEQ